MLLLDEPTAGVDPQSRVRLLELVSKEVDNGTCVLYTTHYMEEAETVCNRLAVMDRGKIIAQGTLLELRSMLAERDLLRLTGTFQPESARDALHGLDGIEVIQAEEDLLMLSVTDAPHRLSEVFSVLSATGSEIRGYKRSHNPAWESLFIKLTGKELRE